MTNVQAVLRFANILSQEKKEKGKRLMLDFIDNKVEFLLKHILLFITQHTTL